MNTIEISIKAYGYFGDDYDGKEIAQNKNIAKNLNDSTLNEKDLKSILECLLSSIKEIKSLFPDEQSDVTYHNDNRLLSITFKVRYNDNTGSNTLTEKFFFKEAARHHSISNLLLEYCKSTDNGEEGSRIWIMDEYDQGPPAGTYAILALVNRSQIWVPNYIEFLRTNDLDHEVEQMWDIRAILEKYGWCEETTRLAIARKVSCCGQAGTEQFKELLNNGLLEYLKVEENRSTFLKDIVQEFFDYDLTTRGKQLLHDSKEHYIKWKTQKLNSFELAITKNEIALLKEQIAIE